MTDPTLDAQEARSRDRLAAWLAANPHPVPVGPRVIDPPAPGQCELPLEAR